MTRLLTLTALVASSLVAFSATALIVAPTAQAADQLAASQPWTGSTAGKCISASQFAATPFTPSVGGRVTTVSAWIYYQSGITYQIRTANADTSPTSTVLGTTAVAPTWITGKDTATFTDGPVLEAGVTYNLVLTNARADCLSFWRPAASGLLAWRTIDGGSYWFGFGTDTERYLTFEVWVAHTNNDLALSGMPADQTVNATSPLGAVVNYTLPTVVDDDGSTVTVGCLPASGSTFAIGSTTVTCTATDTGTDPDTNSPVTETFQVTVNGAGQQLADLRDAALAVDVGSSLVTKVDLASAALDAGARKDACNILSAFSAQVKSLVKNHKISSADGTALTAAAAQTSGVIGCAKK